MLGVSRPMSSHAHIRIARTVASEVWNWDPSNDVGEGFWHTFQAGQTYEVGEVSPYIPEEITALEIMGIGMTELPNDAFYFLDEVRFTFCPNNPSLN